MAGAFVTLDLVAESDCIFADVDKKQTRTIRTFVYHSTYVDREKARVVAKQLLPSSKKANNNKGVYTYVCTKHVSCSKQVRIRSRTISAHDVLVSTDEHGTENADLKHEVRICD